MNIETVEYRRLVSLENYSHEAVGATARVGPGEEPDEALSLLRAWVDQKLDARREADNQECRLLELQRETRELESRHEAARKRWEAALAFLAKHGVSLHEELPF